MRLLSVPLFGELIGREIAQTAVWALAVVVAATLVDDVAGFAHGGGVDVVGLDASLGEPLFDCRGRDFCCIIMLIPRAA